MTEHPRVAAPRADQIDDYHGELVADPYRGLEDTNAPETRAWIDAQNELTEEWLSRVSGREEIRRRLSELWDYPRSTAPFERGGRWFQLRNSGLQDQDVLHVMDSAGDEGRVLLDPNELSTDGTVAVASFAVTADGTLLAYATSAAGSDWMTWHVREVATGQDRPDVVEWSKYAGASWLRDGSGFYYGAVEAPTPGAEYLEAARPPEARLPPARDAAERGRDRVRGSGAARVDVPGRRDRGRAVHRDLDLGGNRPRSPATRARSRAPGERPAPVGGRLLIEGELRRERRQHLLPPHRRWGGAWADRRGGPRAAPNATAGGR